MTILETPRLSLRQMTPDDLPALKRTLQDPIAMTAYEHAFSDQEAQDWLDRQLARYQKDGFGLWAVFTAHPKHTPNPHPIFSSNDN